MNFPLEINTVQFSLSILSLFSGEPCNFPTDYKDWSMPIDHGCLLGQKLVISRRKVNKQCYNGEYFTRRRETKACACIREDFEW